MIRNEYSLVNVLHTKYVNVIFRLKGLMITIVRRKVSLFNVLTEAGLMGSN